MAFREKGMKKILLLIVLLPLSLFAQDVESVLDRAVDVLKNDAAVEMDYAYTVYDDDNEAVYNDRGVMKLDNERYSLLMDEMKVWCDGKTQWSYMKEIDEVYITTADSDEAQNLSPLYIIEKYKKEYSVTCAEKGACRLVTMSAADPDAEVSRVELLINNKDFRLAGIVIYMQSQGRVEVMLDNYKAKCNFGKKEYECPLEEFSTAEIVDMR